MNDLSIDIDPERVSEDYAVYDLEHMVGEEGEVTHFDRPVAMLDPEQDHVEIYRDGERQYSGDVSGLKGFMEEEYDWDMEEICHPATAKVQARLKAYDDRLGSQTREELVNYQYWESISDIGPDFGNVPEP